MCTLLARWLLAEAQDDLVPAGEKVFARCNGYQLVGAPTKTVRSTPHLNNLFGRKPGGPSDIKYSEALVAYGQDKVWDELTLTTFLREPQGLVVCTRMAFVGLKKDEEIEAVLAYLAIFDPEVMAPR